jgi:hypothetical protein
MAGWLMRFGVVTCAVAAAVGAPAAEEPEVSFAERGERLEIAVAGRPFASYVYEDREILRPYFAHVREPGGTQVTRAHPPVQGKDAVDHATMHPGIWLGLGDVSGADFWRNKGVVRQSGFAVKPQGGKGLGRFTASLTYHRTAGEAPMAKQDSAYTVRVLPSGYLLEADLKLAAVGDPLVLGDQEEMGLGLRVASGITATAGGAITNSEGRRSEKEVWGRPADWCDYSGVLDGRRVGMCLMPHPGNFRKSWFHARDYGLLVANPFGQNAFTRGEKSAVRVEVNQPLRLRFAVLVYGGRELQATELGAVFAAYGGR